MNKRLLGVAAAAILAVIGTIAILAYVNNADERAEADVELVDVFVVQDRVAAGAGEATLRAAIGVDTAAAGSVVAGVLTDLDQLEGKVAAVDLVPGEQVLRSRLIDEASFQNGRTQLTSVPTGKHELTVSLDPERVVGGQLVPGDTVAVIASFDPFTLGAIDIDGVSEEEIPALILAADALPVAGETATTTHIMLNKILVTRIQVEQLPREAVDADGNPVDTGQLAPTGNLLVTLAVDAHEVEQIVFSAEYGRIWLSYEPAEADDEGQEVTTRGNVYGHPHEDDELTDLVGNTAAPDDTEEAS